jgi:hypothetical protein
MGFAADLAELMPDTVTIKALSGLSTDGYGTATYTTGTAYTARVVRKQQLVKTFEGIEELATTVVWVASTSTLTSSSQFTLPDGTSPTLLALETYSDEDGITHSKAFFG